MYASLLKKIAMASAAALTIAGCSGSDGADGAPGTSCTVTDNGNGTSTISCQDGTTATVANGTPGADGADGAAGAPGADGRSCTMTANADGTKTVTCPDGGVVVLPAATVSGDVSVTDQTVAISGADVVVTFKVAVNGVASTAFTNKVGAHRHAYSATATPAGWVRTAIAAADFTVVATATGYTVTFPNLAATVGTTPTTYLIRLDTGVAYPQATVVAHSAAGPSKVAVSDQACINCHGDEVFRDALHFGAQPSGVEGCVVCHVRNSTSSRGEANDRLKSYVHGIHNSKAMPARAITASIDPDGAAGPLPAEPFTVTKPDGVYARNDSIRLAAGSYPPGVAELSSPYSIGFPGFMINCSTCHTGPSLAAVNAEPVSWSNCMSCHDNWDGFPRTVAGGSLAGIHRTLTATSDCAGCHNGTVAAGTANAFHDGNATLGYNYTPRNGLVWNGEDQSVVQGKRLVMTVGSVTPAAPNLVVTWSATWDGSAINPCNADVAAGPVFYGLTANAATGQSASNMSILQAYAQANDWVNAGIGTSPGQPASAVTLTAANTTCTGNVATTTVAAAATTATKGVVALQGKPQITFTLAPTTNTRVIQLRSTSPTGEFTVASGAPPATPRRKIVSNEKCISCHQGSIYQHGGNRVDSVELCMMCHNPAANESNNRVAMGVDRTESYDLQPGQTYDLRFMIHAIHSAGETGHPLAYYRSMGIYFFGNAAALDGIGAVWPPTRDALGTLPAADKVYCDPVGGGNGSVYYRVNGSATSGTKPVAPNGAGCGGAGTAPASTDGTWRIHNYIEVHYPRALNDCTACHVDGSENVLPTPWVNVAVTEQDAGASSPSQLDDVLVGPTTASCMSCHQSGNWFEQAVLRRHAYDNSWAPRVFTSGRDDLVNGVEIESCILCHGPGTVADVAAIHAR